MEQRQHPRASGPLQVRYWRAPSPETVGVWLAGATPPGPARIPDPHMNFNEAGLAFDDAAGCTEGDTLLIELAVPGAAERWRAVATVLRVGPVPVDERDDDEQMTHRVAARITSLSDAGRTAIRAYVRRLRPDGTGG